MQKSLAGLSNHRVEPDPDQFADIHANIDSLPGTSVNGLVKASRGKMRRKMVGALGIEPRTS
jgi:hypothetical protein